MLISDVGITKFQNKFLLFEPGSDNYIGCQHNVDYDICDSKGLAPYKK